MEKSLVAEIQVEAQVLESGGAPRSGSPCIVRTGPQIGWDPLWRTWACPSTPGGGKLRPYPRLVTGTVIS
jgi:hypothetical protein